MNRLIAILEKENKLTEERLKHLFRRLCKQAHPDVSPGDEKRFIKLHEEYEKALRIIRDRSAAPARAPHRPTLSGENMTRLLFLYAVKEMTRQAKGLLLELISLLESYDPVAAESWKRYYDLFYCTYPVWAPDGDIFYAHGLLIALIKQFVYFRSTGIRRHRALFFNYAQDLAKRVKKLGTDRAQTLTGIADRLKREIDGRDGTPG